MKDVPGVTAFDTGFGDFKKTRQTGVTKHDIAVGACKMVECESAAVLKGSWHVWGWHCFAKTEQSWF